MLKQVQIPTIFVSLLAASTVLFLASCATLDDYSASNMRAHVAKEQAKSQAQQPASEAVFTNRPAIDTSTPQSPEQACSFIGSIYATAAEGRDIGWDPQTTLMAVSPYQGDLIPGETLKQAINQVYFDPRYANARGALFERQMRDLCRNGGKPRFKPL